MSLAIKYETPEDAKMRLKGTVVLYRGTPVQVQDVIRGETKEDIFRVLFTELPVKGAKAKDFFGRRVRVGDALDDFAGEVKTERKYISSKYFDIAPFRMGYVNRETGNGAFYCERLPTRMQKQGLCGENFKARDNFGQAVPFVEFLTSKEVLAMVADQYPSLDQATKALGRSKAVAFHRDFALVKDEVLDDLIFLFHKGKKVGMFSSTRNETLLGKKFVCLKESLEEMRLKVGVC